MVIVPPGGFAGYSQMTPASKAALFRTTARRAPSRRKRRTKKSGTSSRKARRASSGRKLKFGSPAWQKKYKVGKYRR